MRPASYQRTGQPGGQERDAVRQEYQIQVEPPGPERVFRVESEAALFERIRQEFRQTGVPADRAEFPPEPQVGEEEGLYAGRSWPPQTAVAVPQVVCYNPLYFEDKNTERYGWDACIFQPLLSTGKFYLDLAMLPYNIGVLPPWQCECNVGYHLPGDPVPYHLYIPPFSLKGLGLEIGTIAAGAAILP